MVTEPTFYNKKSGYYVSHQEQKRNSSKVEQQEIDDNASLIEFPWDNDSFSLCLESFPSAKLSIKKYNKLPVTASPLRMQWISANSSSSGEDVSQGNESVSIATTDSISRSIRKKKLAINSTIDNSFPYINDDTFLDRIQTVKKKPQPQKQKEKIGRIQHISPLMNSSIIFNEQDILFKCFSTKSISTHNNQSQVSNTSTIESWKVAQSPVTGMKSPIVLPPNPLITRENYASGSVIPRSYNSTNSSESLNYSDSIKSIEKNSISASGVYYTPPASVTSTKSYRSVHVPKNADNLVFYSDSIYSTTPTEKNRSYSQLFNPTYQQSRNKKSVGLFTKLMKNFKHHFAK